MTISFQRYIDIISGVGGGAAVGEVQLISRIFTTNPLLPTQSFIEFANAEDVGTYFGFSSEEYNRAAFYFSWISKNTTQAQLLSFARWTNVAVGSEIFGKPATYSLSNFSSVTTGDFTMTFGGFTFHMTSINLSAAGSLAAVATDIQAKINAQSGGGVAWTGATVSFDAVRGCFNFVSGATGTDTITVTAGVATDVASLLGWLTGAILSNGSGAETLTQTINASISASNNFGSFFFIGGSAFTLSQQIEIAIANATYNNQFKYLCSVTASNAAATSAALIGFAGVAMVLKGAAGQYHEMMEGVIEAATNYAARNSVQNYMYQQFPTFTPTVTNDADANTYDALRVNYLGVTQNAGQQIAFYQTGILTGGATNPTDSNTFANEQWLKARAGTELMSLLLSVAQVPANSQGIGQINAVLQNVINDALFNGTISVGKPINTIQQLYITNATGDPNAWRQVQTIGYWVGVTISSYVQNGVTKWQAIYTLIYAKDDVVRKIVGTHTLI